MALIIFLIITLPVITLAAIAGIRNIYKEFGAYAITLLLPILLVGICFSWIVAGIIVLSIGCMAIAA